MAEVGPNPPKPDMGSRLGQRNLYMAEFAACMGDMSFGLTSGFSSPALPDIRKRMAISDNEGDWFASLVNIGGIVGALAAGTSHLPRAETKGYDSQLMRTKTVQMCVRFLL